MHKRNPDAILSGQREKQRDNHTSLEVERHPTALAADVIFLAVAFLGVTFIVYVPRNRRRDRWKKGPEPGNSYYRASACLSH